MKIIRVLTRIGASALVTSTLGAALLLSAPLIAQAEDVTLSITITPDRKFDPVELHAPAGAAITIRIKNLSATPCEFESSELHFEKIVPAGKEGAVHVRPLQPGRYNFFDDFHRDTQGLLIVP